MTKQDIVNAVAAQAGISKVAATNAVNAFINAISDSLTQGNNVTLTGFGTFRKAWQKERERVDLRTGERKMYPGKWVVKFKPGKNLKESVL